MKYYKFMLVQGSKEGRHGNVFYIEILIAHGTNYCLNDNHDCSCHDMNKYLFQYFFDMFLADAYDI